MLFICYERCSTCKKAQKWLTERSISYQARDIKSDRPTFDELREWVVKSKLPIKRFWNVSGLQYRALDLKSKLQTMSDEEQLELLSTDGMLLKRPLLIDENMILVGFKEAEWQNALSK